ncbi:N-formylglutamate amidohydrolase [Thalassobaculum sp. OXR-137]|uniref:N-formylglutamate amidohydrolase n=1 Tax=Thalassobaculum sp. OXR-137 TaxID=3100173 RepID=UPI002AC90DE9|nr:N-formylglutamate amidohydrolase [Thalassobaculum sp. OXR-137]WPZ32300.1 N-formylglutamate amidohydrolase [Thalassobaculum sp. OXR-137]
MDERADSLPDSADLGMPTAAASCDPATGPALPAPAPSVAAAALPAAMPAAPGAALAGSHPGAADPAPPPVKVLRPVRQTLPIVVSSPHSGRHYPDDLLTRTGLDERTLRSSEDSFVDELFAAAPELGAPLVAATFPRVYVDANRAPYELDPAMFSDPLPDYVTTRNARIAAGLGTIARVVSNAVPVYADKLAFRDAEHRIEGYWRPYHAALTEAIEETRNRFGFCILVDAHSMPSNVQTIGADGRSYPVGDIVLGDCHGTSCSPVMTSRVERLLGHQGYRVRRNSPYAGGYVTRHYGRPDLGVHALQIEVKRGLYMNEKRLERTAGLQRLAADMRRAIAGLASFDPRRPLGDAD